MTENIRYLQDTLQSVVAQTPVDYHALDDILLELWHEPSNVRDKIIGIIFNDICLDVRPEPIKHLLDFYAQNNEKYPYAADFLTHAAAAEDIETLAMLIFDYNYLNLVNIEESFSAACEMGKTKSIEFFLDSGTVTESILQRGIAELADNDKAHLLPLLLSGPVNVNTEDFDGGIFISCYEGNLDFLQALLESDFGRDFAKNCRGAFIEYRGKPKKTYQYLEDYLVKHNLVDVVAQDISLHVKGVKALERHFDFFKNHLPKSLKDEAHLPPKLSAHFLKKEISSTTKTKTRKI